MPVNAVTAQANPRLLLEIRQVNPRVSLQDRSTHAGRAAGYKSLMILAIARTQKTVLALLRRRACHQINARRNHGAASQPL